MIEIIKKRNIKEYLTIVGIAFVFLLLFSNGTSPLTHYYGSDSAFFIFVGKAMKHGYLPYIELFDHKGPYLFWIQEIGQIICEDKTGAFIIQLVNLSICMFITDSIISVSNNKNFKNRLLYQIPLGLVFAISFRDGNMCEEYSLPYLLICLYLFIKYLKIVESGKYIHKKEYAFIYGLFFTILAFIRITNSAFLCACVLTIFIILLINKEYKNILENIIYFFCGVVVGILPLLIYYSMIDGIDEMLYSTFIFGYKYSSKFPLSFKIKVYFTLKNIFLISTVNIPVLYLLLNNKTRSYEFLFSIISALATFIATFLGFAFTHYFVLVIPNYLFGIYLIGSGMINNKVLRVFMITLIAGHCLFMLEGLGKNILQIADYSISEDKANYYKDQEMADIDIGNRIPEEFKNSVWGYEIKSKFYLRTNTYPSIKYFDYVDQRLTYPELAVEIEELLYENKPKYMVISKDKKELPSFIDSLLESNYSLTYENNTYYLYCLK